MISNHIVYQLINGLKWNNDSTFNDFVSAKNEILYDKRKGENIRRIFDLLIKDIKNDILFLSSFKSISKK